MTPGNREYRFYGSIVALYVAMQLISDITAGKITVLFGYPVSVTILYFPVTYIFADVLTEVYGYARSRRALWTVMLCSVIAGILYQVATMLPPAPGFDANDAYVRVLGQVPRILLGGWIAVFAGEIANNYVIARMKVAFQGRYLWLRIVGSTIVGQLLNTGLFYFIALYGVLPRSLLIESILTGWMAKVLVEMIMTPITYLVINKLKTIEGEDYFDTKTDFNPFIIR